MSENTNRVSTTAWVIGVVGYYPRVGAHFFLPSSDTPVVTVHIARGVDVVVTREQADALATAFRTAADDLSLRMEPWAEDAPDADCASRY